MEWQNPERSNTSSRRSLVSSGLSYSVNYPVLGWQWSFTPISSAPVWPQSYSSAPLSVAPDNLSDPTFDSIWNELHAEFDGSTLWEQWDDRGELGDDQAVILDAQRPSDVPAASAFEQATLNPGFTPLGFEMQPEDAFDSQTQPGYGYADARNSSITSMEESPSATWSAGVSSSSCSTRQFTSQDSSASWSEITSPRAGVSARDTRLQQSSSVGFTTGSGSRAMQSELTQPIPLSSPRSVRKGKPKVRASFRSSSTGSVLSPQRQSHQETEKTYRTKLNDGFTSLFKALPEDYVASGTGGELASGVSKLATLQLALDRISILEQQEKQLSQESLVLRAQVRLFECLIKPPDSR